MRLQRFSFAEVWQNRFFSVVRDKSLKDKNIRSKHRKRVPTSVFSPSRAAARRLKVVCGVRVEEVEDPLMREIRCLDKLIDELAKGKPMEKILRK